MSDITPSQSSSLSASMTLEEVAKNFELWRNNRHRKGKIPTELMTQACTLTGRYPVAKIVGILKLSYSGFKAECAQRGIAVHPSMLGDNNTAFVEIEQFFGQSSNTVPFEVVRPDGATLRVTLAQSEASHFLSQFLRG